MKQKKGNKKKFQLGVTVGADVNDALERMAKETHINKSTLVRMSIAEMLEGKHNDPDIALNLVLLTQELNNAKDVLPADKFSRIQNYMGNIIKIKGGK